MHLVEVPHPPWQELCKVPRNCIHQAQHMQKPIKPVELELLLIGSVQFTLISCLSLTACVQRTTT
jgi:hypothetical protein